MSAKDDCPLLAADVRYKLFTAYPYVVNKATGSLQIQPNVGASIDRFSHAIMDSGLFTLMWGAGKGQVLTYDFLRDWMHRLCEFAEINDVKASIVECDCQKLLSPDAAWKLRREMRDIIPNREVINVFHIEDGESGFRKLVEFSDYIAISVPEFRIEQPKRFRSTVSGLARLARKLKPSVKIHLLGCTDDYLLEKNRFCTSADSSSWTFFTRSSNSTYGYHRNDISEDGLNVALEKVRAKARELEVQFTDKGEIGAAKQYIGAALSRDHYQRYAGPQD